MHSVLVVDDERDIRESLRGILEDEGYKVLLAESGEACLEQLKKRSCEAVLLDIWLPGIDGLETLERIRQLEDPPEVVIISGHGTIETAVRATKLGAFDFLEKPLSLDRTLIVLKNALEAHRLRLENAEFKKQFQAKSVIVGESIPMKALRHEIARDGADQWPRADLRRIRNRQGTGSARHPRQQLAERQAVRGSELRRHPGRLD